MDEYLYGFLTEKFSIFNKHSRKMLVAISRHEGFKSIVKLNICTLVLFDTLNNTKVGRNHMTYLGLTCSDELFKIHAVNNKIIDEPELVE